MCACATHVDVAVVVTAEARLGLRDEAARRREVLGPEVSGRNRSETTNCAVAETSVDAMKEAEKVCLRREL